MKLTMSAKQEILRQVLDILGAGGAPRMLNTRVIEDAGMVLHDWSACRSPARARRRLKLGHPQHVIITPRPGGLMLPDGTVVMHPAEAAKLRERLAAAGAREVKRIPR